jgi:oligopeptidase B
VNSRPTAQKRPHDITRHGDTRIDPYYWLMDRDDPEVISHLESENVFLSEQLAHLEPLRDELFADIKSHVEETDTSVPVKKGSWWYFDRTKEGLSYSMSCRAPLSPDTLEPPAISADSTLVGEQVILDENLEAEGHEFCSVGVLNVSPNEQWVAVGVDFSGYERHTLTVRPLNGQPALDDVIENVYYGFTWANDSRHFFYTTVDDSMRPYRVWRHEIGTAASSDVVIYEESDQQFSLSVARSRDDAVIVVMIGSKTTSEIRYLSADRPTDPLEILEARRTGIEYDAEHWHDENGRGWWLKLTNDDATDFRLLARANDDAQWRELIAHRPGTRLDGVDAFATFLAISERFEGSATVRLVSLLGATDPFGSDLITRSQLVRTHVDPSTVVVEANPEFDTTYLRVVMTSLVTPRTVTDYYVATGTSAIRKRQIVKGDYREDDYVTSRLWFAASDGTKIPVSLVARRDLVDVDDHGRMAPRAPTPLVLYGYGSYEISIDPTFSAIRLSLLNRGVIFAIAHVRGGGEMGRAWYDMGKMAQKATTFSDFVAVATALIDNGWTTPAQLAARGGSAGGLLIGAAINLAPDLFKCVVADVPFVDALTTMLDDTLPLTVGEYEEWGNPDASATVYRTMKSYSPYDNVRSTNDDGSERIYPHVFAAGGLNDSRVGFWEPAKWVQRLRDANEKNVVYLKTEMGNGHAGPSGRYDAWKEEAEVLSFVVSEITRL